MPGVRRALSAAFMMFVCLATLAHADEAFLRIENGSVVWSRDVAVPPQPSSIVQLARMAPGRNPTLELREDPAALQVLASHGTLRQWALTRLSERTMDSAQADSLLALASTIPGLWRYDAMHARFARSSSAGDTSFAARVLGREEPADLSSADQVAWTLAAARFALRTTDTHFAWQRAWRVIERDEDRWVFPADSFAVATELVLRVREARGVPLSASEAFQMARALVRIRNYSDADPFFAAAGAHIEDPGERLTANLERADALRLNKRTTRGREVLANLAGSDASERAAILLMRARIERADGRYSAADRLYARAIEEASVTPGDEILADAARHRADLAWARTRWTTARGLYEDSWKRTRDEESRLRAGLLALRTVGGDAAYAWWAGNGSAAESRFWMALGTRRSKRARADSILRIVADEPGFAYRFHQAAARETLGIQMAVESVAHASAPGEGPDWLRDADLFLEIGDRDATLRVLAHALDMGSASLARAGFPTARHWLRASAIAYSLHDYPLGIRMAFRARWSPREWRDGLTTEEILPWMYPPAFDSIYVREARRKKLDPDLFRSIGWQESFYDEDVVSRAGALGVMQFMPYTARQVAAELGETFDADSLLLEADRSIRFSAHYLSGLLRRYGGRTPQALAAYNAGPGNANRWGRRARGWSDAYFVEMIDFTETRGYVRNILAVRQAYRTFKPHWADSMAAQ